MTIEVTENEIYWCRTCEAETTTANNTCLKCGRKMDKQSFIKMLGKLSLGVSIFIMIGTGLLFVGAAVIRLFSETLSGEVSNIFLLRCGLAMIVGVVSIIGTAQQAKTGHTSKRFIWTLYGVLFVNLIFSGLFPIFKL